MLHLRALGLLDVSVLTVTGEPLARTLDWWEASDRRKRLRERLFEEDGVDPDDVIMSPAQARERGLTSTVTFPRGNLAPEGSVIKSTAIDPSVVDPDGVYRKTGPARVFTREKDAIAAIKGQGDQPIKPGDVLVLIGRGPMGAGMEEIYQITAALRHLSFGKHVAVLTDARFSGVSTGACIGHVGPEALAGGPARQGPRRRPDPDRRRSRQPRRARSTWSAPRARVRTGRGLARPRRPRSPPAALPRSRPARRHPPLGGPAGTSAAAPGAAASTTPTPSSRPCGVVRKLQRWIGAPDFPPSGQESGSQA